MIYWLVIPEFEGACVVTPALLVKLQEVVDLFHKLKEERLSKRESISDAVERYVEENGFEALEKLIESEVSSYIYMARFRKVFSLKEKQNLNVVIGNMKMFLVPFRLD